MAQESRHPFRLFGPGKKRLNKNLREPFLSPGGSVHTTEAIEKSKLPARWLVLLLLSVLMIGNYYCYDNPAALYSMLAARFSSAEHFDFYFDGLYSVYSLPNIVLPLIGGMIVDRWGVAKSLCLFTLLILLGQAIFAAACSAGWLNGMLLGRTFFGLGGENLSVAQSAFVTQWFQTKELAFALGITLSVARFGSVLNNTLSPWLAARLGSVAAALWVGVAICAASLLCAHAHPNPSPSPSREPKPKPKPKPKPEPEPEPRPEPEPKPRPEPEPKPKPDPAQVRSRARRARRAPLARHPAQAH